MKRFYKEAGFGRAQTVPDSNQASGPLWQVELDGRPVKTQGGRAQLVPSEGLAKLLCGEWAAQGEELDPKTLPLRDMTDYALDVIAPDPAASIARILPYGETDTLCYRGDPEDALFARQRDIWDPLLSAFEQRESITMVRVSGIMHKPQTPQAMALFKARLSALDPYQLAALESLTALAASLVIGLSAIEAEADIDLLWSAANLEEDWQIELWGEDLEAAETRARRTRDFHGAAQFIRAARAA